MLARRLALVALLAAAGCSSGAGGKTGTGGRGGTTGNAGTTGAGGATGASGTTGNAGTTGAGGGNVDAGVDTAQVPFEEQILAIAAEYLAWGRVDDELRWAPGLCRLPYPGVAHESTSTDPNTHGQKLYSMFARNWAAYPDGPQDGQAVVKQSWKVEQVDAAWMPSQSTPTAYDADHFYPYAKGPDGGVFKASEPAGLYIMFRLDPSTPETDEGWVYATVTPDGQITAAGRVASCMGCHETAATHERLFGVPKSPYQ